jgi:hypothetical protein
MVEYIFYFFDGRIHASGRDQPGERQNTDAACA